MKQHIQKKGLFLTEILLSVVIAAIIMSSAFLLYTNIQSEAEKNDAISDLNMIISMTHPILGAERGSNFTNTDALDQTALFVRTRLLPNTVEIDTAAYTAKSAYGYDLSLGMWERESNSNWRVTYSNLDAEQCTKYMQAAIKATSPLIVGTVDHNNNPTQGYQRPGNAVCGSTATPLSHASSFCASAPGSDDQYHTVTFVYSPNNETSTVGGIKCFPYRHGGSSQTMDD
jgi:Tfp pilus assembly protein PilE